MEYINSQPKLLPQPFVEDSRGSGGIFVFHEYFL